MELQSRETDQAPPGRADLQALEAATTAIDDTKRTLLKRLLAAVVIGITGTKCGALGQATKKEKNYEGDPRYQQFTKELRDTIYVAEYTVKLIQNYAKETLQTHDPVKIFAFGEEFRRASADIGENLEKLIEDHDRLIAEIQATDPDLAEAISGKSEEIATAKENLAAQLTALFYKYVSACDELISKVNEGTFKQEVLEQKGIMLVFLSAEWCPPCKFVTPLIAEFGEQAKKAIEVKKVILSTEDHKDINLGIVSYLLGEGIMPRSLPSFILFISGKPGKVAIGAFNSIDEIQQFITQGLTDYMEKDLQKENPETVPDELINPDKSPIEI